jgi:hypothetical protein
MHSVQSHLSGEGAVNDTPVGEEDSEGTEEEEEEEEDLDEEHPEVVVVQHPYEEVARALRLEGDSLANQLGHILAGGVMPPSASLLNGNNSGLN